MVPAAIEQVREARIFSKLDLRCAYNLIRICEGDEWKTAFIANSVHYKYLVMPFGLSNSPSVFQSFMNEVFNDMLNRFVLIYIDDILIYSTSLESHIQHIKLVLQRLSEHHLYVKAEKCEFPISSIFFLGYVLSAGGARMDQSKVQAVVEWPAPRSVKELQQFLGFANFFSAGSALVPCSAGSTSVPGHSTSTWTWPSVPSLLCLRLCSTALLVCIGASGSHSLGGLCHEFCPCTSVHSPPEVKSSQVKSPLFI